MSEHLENCGDDDRQMPLCLLLPDMQDVFLGVDEEVRQRAMNVLANVSSETQGVVDGEEFMDVSTWAKFFGERPVQVLLQDSSGRYVVAQLKYTVFKTPKPGHLTATKGEKRFLLMKTLDANRKTRVLTDDDLEKTRIWVI